jgi:alpha/beta superfamily hydrolase
VQKLVDLLRSQKGIDVDFSQIENANHFFRGEMGTMVETVNEYLNKACAGRSIDVQKLLRAA